MADNELVPLAARLVRDFVNTYEPQTDQESWTTPESLVEWMAERHLLPSDARLRRADLGAAITLREGLRTILLEHAGHEPDHESVERLNETLADLPVRLTIPGGGGGYRIGSASDTSFGSAVAQLADAIRACTEDGSWSRLKACSRASCHWAYYDASRNQVRRWCSMATCGNHVKMQRAYAERKRRSQSPISGG